MNEQIFEQIKTFIFKEGFGRSYKFPFSFKRKTITCDMEIEKDLIMGDDADEFLISLGKEFNVDVSQFPLGYYFESEVPFGFLPPNRNQKKCLLLNTL